MLRVVITLLSASAGFFVLLTVGPFFGFAHFGPCGPDVPGLFLFGGLLLSLALGFPIALFALVQRGLRQLQNRNSEDIESSAR